MGLVCNFCKLHKSMQRCDWLRTRKSNHIDFKNGYLAFKLNPQNSVFPLKDYIQCQQDVYDLYNQLCMLLRTSM